jgi:plasmid stabilization system protein ParE
MPHYELAEGAEEDLQGIAQYTVSRWGAKQAMRYGAVLEKHFRAVGDGRIRTRIFLPHRPQLRVSRVEHHYVFHLERPEKRPLILAVFHESMDLVARLHNRLDV